MGFFKWGDTGLVVEGPPDSRCWYTWNAMMGNVKVKVAGREETHAKQITAAAQ